MAESLTFRELEIFVAFAEVEHLGRAAEALELSVPAVQRAVRSIEAHLGVPLVRRDGRRVRLLHAGRILADQASKVIRSRAEALDAVLVAAGRERHLLRVGYIYSLGLRVLPELIADMLSQEPAIRVGLRHGATDELVDALLAGELDAVCVAPLPSLAGVSCSALFTECSAAAALRNTARRSVLRGRRELERTVCALEKPGDTNSSDGEYRAAMKNYQQAFVLSVEDFAVNTRLAAKVGGSAFHRGLATDADEWFVPLGEFLNGVDT